MSPLTRPYESVPPSPSPVAGPSAGRAGPKCQRRRKSTSPGRSKSASLIDKLERRWVRSGGVRGGPSPSPFRRTSKLSNPVAGQFGFLGWLVRSDSFLAVLEPEAVAVHLKDMDMVGEAIEQRTGEALGAKHTGPLIEGQVAGDDDRAALVALA